MKISPIKSLKYLCLILISWFVVHSIFIVVDGLSDSGNKADIAIVLGNKVNPNGKPSERLKQRLNKSIELYKNSRVKKVLVSGGFGKEKFWEGNVMRDYLVQNEIPKTDILVDNFGNDTEKTVDNSIRIMDSLDYQSAISVSQHFHQTRTKMLFKKNGFENIESASPNYFEWRDFYSIFREFIAFYKEKFFN